MAEIQGIQEEATTKNVMLHIQTAVASMCEAANWSQFNDANMTANYSDIVECITKEANDDLDVLTKGAQKHNDDNEKDPQFSQDNMTYQQAQQTWSGYENAANSDVQLANEMVSTASSRQQDVLKLGNEVSAAMVYVSGLIQAAY